MTLKEKINKLEKLLNQETEFISENCVDFMHSDWSLTIYKEKITIHNVGLEELELTTEMLNLIKMIQNNLKDLENM